MAVERASEREVKPAFIAGQDLESTSVYGPRNIGAMEDGAFTVSSTRHAKRRQGGLIYIRVRPTWIRYSDYNVDPPQIVEFTADDLVRKT